MAIQSTSNSTDCNSPRDNTLRSPTNETELTEHTSRNNNGENPSISALRGLSDASEEHNSSSSTTSKSIPKAQPTVYEVGEPSTTTFPLTNDTTLMQDAEYQRLLHLRQQHLQIVDCLNHQLSEMQRKAQEARTVIDTTRDEIQKMTPRRQLDQQPSNIRSVEDHEVKKKSNSKTSEVVPTTREEQIAQITAQQIQIAIPLIVALSQNADMNNLKPRVGDKRKGIGDQIKENDEGFSVKNNLTIAKKNKSIMKKGNKLYQGKLPLCQLCGKHHLGKSCQGMICFRCKKSGHTFRNCKELGRFKPVCFHCGEEGHIRNACPRLRK